MSRLPTKRSARRVSKKASAPANPSPRKLDRFAGVNPKLAALLRKHFTKKGRAARLARAEKALQEMREIGATFKVDDDTWKWVAQSKDLEDI